MARSTVFKTNRTQAVRIPKELAFPDSVKEVEIIRDGNRLLIVPKYQNWNEWFEHGPRMSEDFMVDRAQGKPDEREPL